MNYSYSKKTPYFVFDEAECGFCFFATEKERDQYADERIQEYSHEGRWPLDVEGILGGLITHKATQVNKEKPPPDDQLDDDRMDKNGECWDEDCDYRCDYKLLKDDK